MNPHTHPKSASKSICSLYLCLTLIFLPSALSAAETVPLPRIIVSEDAGKAVFRNSESGEVFQPIGSSYLPRMHKTFSPGTYDPEHAEAALAKMAEAGFTTVRIWAYHGHFKYRRDGSFAMEGPDFQNQHTSELSQPYVDNLVDFISRANRHKIYVHLVIDREPDTPFYRDLVNSGYPDVKGHHHREYLTSGSMKAKEIYIAELLNNFKARDPKLLSTIFAYEIRNEIHANTAHPPFSLTEGMVETAAGSYDMGNPASRLACFGDNIRLFLSRTTKALKEADPEALATSSIFAYLPVGKDGLVGEGLLPIEMQDKRWPVLPEVLVESDLDFVSFHSYFPHDWQKALASSRFVEDFLKKKPFVCGEFGAQRTAFADASSAADALSKYRDGILASGFSGAYLFTWDTEQHTRWTMLEDDAAIYNALRLKK